MSVICTRGTAILFARDHPRHSRAKREARERKKRRAGSVHSLSVNNGIRGAMRAVFEDHQAGVEVKRATVQAPPENAMGYQASTSPTAACPHKHTREGDERQQHAVSEGRACSTRSRHQRLWPTRLPLRGEGKGRRSTGWSMEHRPSVTSRYTYPVATAYEFQ